LHAISLIVAVGVTLVQAAVTIGFPYLWSAAIATRLLAGVGEALMYPEYGSETTPPFVGRTLQPDHVVPFHAHQPIRSAGFCNAAITTA